MKIIYSLNKKGFEADYWEREIPAASGGRYQFIPFNHDPYLNTRLYQRAQLLDDLFFEKHPGLMRMYADLEARIHQTRADVLLVDNCFPYHPEFLRRLKIYKVLRTTDGPICAYDRDFPYIHAYHHVFYHSPAYSSDLDMRQKLEYLGARNVDFWPLGLFDKLHDPSQTAETIMSRERDIDVIFIGALHWGKMPLLAKVKKALGGRRFRLFGAVGWKRNLYFNWKFGFPGWISSIPFEQYVPLYQRSKIGINVHNRGDFTVGSYRLFDLPGNGVLQISDGGKFLDEFFEVDKEIVGYRNADDLIDKILYYLENEAARRTIALNGFQRVMRDYRIGDLLHKAGDLIGRGMERIGWRG